MKKGGGNLASVSPSPSLCICRKATLLAQLPSLARSLSHTSATLRQRMSARTLYPNLESPFPSVPSGNTTGTATRKRRQEMIRDLVTFCFGRLSYDIFRATIWVKFWSFPIMYCTISLLTQCDFLHSAPSLDGANGGLCDRPRLQLKTTLSPSFVGEGGRPLTQEGFRGSSGVYS